MKALVTQENLNKALSTVSKVASSRTTLPILSNILIKASKGSLKISATNLEMAVTAEFGAKVDEEGELTIPARLSTEFISSLPHENITLTSEGSNLLVSSTGYESVLNGTSSEEYPSLPTISSKNKITLKTAELKKALNQVLFASSSDDSRPVLTGVLFTNHDGFIYLVATDSYRLAEKRLVESKDDINCIVPASALTELSRIMNDTEEEVMLSWDDQQMRFSVGGVELITRLIDGKYPDYRQLIPAKGEFLMEIEKPSFVSVAKISGLFARESAGSITLHIDGDLGELVVSSVASQLGQNKATSKIVSSGSADITLNSKYLLDGLAAINSDGVDFSFSTKTTPCIMSAQGETDVDYKHVIMPLRS
jgi:DNA polymerase III subunit beta